MIENDKVTALLEDYDAGKLHPEGFVQAMRAISRLAAPASHDAKSGELAQVVADMREQAESMEGDGGCEGAWAFHQARFADRIEAALLATPKPEAAGALAGEGDDEASDVSVWTLLGLMEEAGAVRDEGEEGFFWTVSLENAYALEARLRARNVDPGWAAALSAAPVAAQHPAKDVHTEHCCASHGCKYGDDDCTVTTGRHPQSYPCEECDETPAQQPAVVDLEKFRHPVQAWIVHLAVEVKRAEASGQRAAINHVGALMRKAGRLLALIDAQAALTPAATPVPVGGEGRERQLVGAIRSMLSAMEMQERREAGEFHLSQPAAKHHWDTAKNRAHEALAHPPQDSDCYYIQDTRQFVGNCPMWWCPDGKGYTAHLSRAGRYPKDEALRIAASRGTDRAWPCSVIDAIASRMVDMQEMPATPPAADADGGAE